MRKKEFLLSVVVPAYNEENRIEKSLLRIYGYLRSQSYISEIIIVDDGSRDKTVEIVTKFIANIDNLRIIRNGRNRGKGFSVKNGLMHANGEFLLFSDADLSTPIEEVAKLLAYYREGYDIVIGSRGLKESDIQIHQLWYREFMGRIFNLFVVLLAVRGFKDTQCGFKGFSREAALEICKRQRMEGFSFDVEMLYIAKKLGYRIKEVPIQWFDSPQTKVNTLRDSRKMFMDLLRVRINDWKGLYS